MIAPATNGKARAAASSADAMPPSSSTKASTPYTARNHSGSE